MSDKPQIVKSYRGKYTTVRIWKEGDEYTAYWSWWPLGGFITRSKNLERLKWELKHRHRYAFIDDAPAIAPPMYS